jgi:hypothetical protein
VNSGAPEFLEGVDDPDTSVLQTLERWRAVFAETGERLGFGRKTWFFKRWMEDLFGADRPFAAETYTALAGQAGEICNDLRADGGRAAWMLLELRDSFQAAACGFRKLPIITPCCFGLHPTVEQNPNVDIMEMLAEAPDKLILKLGREERARGL